MKNEDLADDEAVQAHVQLLHYPDWPLADPEVRRALEVTFDSGDWGRYHGNQCAALADELSSYHHEAQVMLCASGTIGVELALRGLGVQRGDEVILAAYDFPGNFRAVEAIGARPVLVDLADARWTIDLDNLKSAVSDRTKALIVSHLHGDLVPMRECISLAHGLRLQVLEDACQATGAMIDGRRAGTWGDVGVLSFGGSKLLTAGRGGAILTHVQQIHQRAKIANERGNEAYPLSELQAAVLRPQLKKLDDRNHTRWNNAKRLLQFLGNCPQLSPVLIADGAGTMPSFYKMAWSYQSSTGSSRDEFLQRVVSQGLPMGEGFRGFFRRSSRRCRCVGRLDRSRSIASQTILLHHPPLLAQTNVLQKVATMIHRALAACQ